jgi:hypothetical protein
MKTPCPLKLQGILFTLISMLLVLSPMQAVVVQAASSTTISAVPSSSTPLLGETFTVNITISDVQNLYAIDVTLRWNASVLQVLNINSRLGVESHPDGVLHENLPNSPIEIIDDTLSLETGEYHIAATSVTPSPSFSGSGNVATITFNVTASGHSGLELESELAAYPTSDEPAPFIEHTISNGSVNVIPEFPSIITVALFLVLATTAVVFSKKRLKHTSQSA